MKQLLIATLVFFCPNLIFAANDLKIVHDSQEEVILELSADELQTESIIQNGESYTKLNVNGFNDFGEEGGPALPKKSRYVAIPYNTNPVINILSKNSRTLTVQHKVSFNEARKTHCSTLDQKTLINLDLYKKVAYKKPILASEPSFIGPVKAILLTYSPAVLTDDPNVLELNEKMIIKISFEKTNKTDIPPVNPYKLNDKDFSFYRSMVINKSPLGTLYRKNHSVTEQLIITHSSYESALQEYINFRAINGGARVKYFDNEKADVIKKFILEQYQKDPPSHTLIIGSIEQIPSFKYSGFWTDYTYSLLDSGNQPDISIGRLPARNETELRQLVAKIIAREKNNFADEEILLTSGFETGWCQQNLKFITNNILANSENKLNVTKLYASEGARTAKIVEGYNNNPNVIIYDGHGNHKGMTEIPLLIEHLPQLTNTVYPIVLDIACLNSYWPSSGISQRNFAESIATLNNAGAAGILAASSNAGAHDLFRHILRANVYDDKDQTERYHKINEIGKMVLFGKLKYYEQYGGSASSDNYMFYYHGDPATKFFKE